MTQASDEIIERIKKILDRSKDPNAPAGEVEAALAAAKRLMEKYSVALDEVLTREQSARDSAFESMVDEEAYARSGSVDEWDKQVACAVCKVCDIAFYNRWEYRDNKRGNPARMHVIKFYGLPRDVAVGKYLYMELLATMRAMYRLRFGKDMSESRSYWLGFSQRLLQRAIEETTKPPPISDPAATTANAIVLVKGNLLDRYAEKLGLAPGRRRGGGRRDGVSTAYTTGHADGGKVSLSTNGIGGGRSAPAPKLLP
jgi:hypothetical protein